MDTQIDPPTIDRIVKQLTEGAQDRMRLGYLVGRVEDGKGIVERVDIPEQRSDKLTTSIPSEKELRAIYNIKKDGKDILGFALYYTGPPAFLERTIKNFRRRVSQQGLPDLMVVVDSNVVDSEGQYQIIK